jgi:hypothetical protein
MRPPRSIETSRDRNWGAVSAVSRVKCMRAPLLELVLWFGRNSHGVMITRLIEMRVIALGRWTLLPSRRSPRHLLFETNWSGADQSYIPDFAVLMPLQWRSIWGTTKGFPGPMPTKKLLEHIDTVDWGADHMWSDYRPDATTQTVLAALELRDELHDFVTDTRGLPPDRFAARWRRFSTDVQRLL